MSVALLLVLAVGGQSLGGALVDGGPELGKRRPACARQAPARPRPGPGRPCPDARGDAPVGPAGRGAAECAAVQRDAHTARLLGAAAADAAGLALAYRRDLYPLMPDGYRSSECRSGGALD